MNLHNVEIPHDKPYSIIIIEMPTTNLRNRRYRVEGYDYESDVEVFVSGDLGYCNEQFEWIRDRISEAGMNVGEVGSHSIHVPRQMLINTDPKIVTRNIVNNLARYPIIKSEKMRLAHRLANVNKKLNGAYSK